MRFAFRHRAPFILLGTLCLLLQAVALRADVIRIPRVSAPPRLEDFEGMEPSGAAREMVKTGAFTQNFPADGERPTERTDAYIGYDNRNLYVVFVCQDSKKGVRASLTNREPSTPFDSDDYVEVALDPFHDQRHGYVFYVNPLGVQADALRTEGQGTDYSWDAVWNSRGRITSEGYVVWMEISFRSLRFNPMQMNGWGMVLARYVARRNETDYWPAVSGKISGVLNQEATVTGLEGISPGRNIQLTPYLEDKSFRTVNTRVPAEPFFSRAVIEGRAGIDGKFVFRDSLVLDATVNPDFAQVESDTPQNVLNQRFEVYFPEKRPFFLENSNFFEAPLIAANLQARLVFTRRIADPKLGLRLSGKQGPWNLGFLEANDCGPGNTVAPGDPDYHKCAKFGIGRVSHDIGKRSSVGVEYTDREFRGTFSRAGGLDGTFILNKNWSASYRGYVSSMQPESTATNPAYQFGHFHEGVLVSNGLRFSFSLQFLDITPNFGTQTGFVPRTDQRTINEYGHFYWRPKKGLLMQHGPEENATQLWDNHGTTLQQIVSFDYVFEVRPNVVIAPIVAYESDVLRPIDFSGLPGNRQYVQDGGGIVFRGSPKRWLNWNSTIIRDGTPVVIVPTGQLPYTGNETAITQTLGLKPVGRLQIDNMYILERIVNGKAHHAVLNSHIIRSRVNYQFTRELSLRFIGQYNGQLANANYSSLQTEKNFNMDFLLTYLVHPGTAVYVGYNSNMENVDPSLCVHLPGTTECNPNGPGLLRTRSQFTNDGRQIFIKMSYQFRR
jgi:hypothetical protein